MKNILIVDDQPYMFQLFMNQLSEKGYTTINAEDIEKAETYLNIFKIHLVILDLYINGFNGLDLLETIKKRYPHLPVLLLTAYDNFMNDQRARHADGYLVKNFKNIDILCKKVEEMLS